MCRIISLITRVAIVTAILNIASQFIEGKRSDWYEDSKNSNSDDKNIRFLKLNLFSSNSKRSLRGGSLPRNNTIIDYHNYYSTAKISNSSAHWIEVDSQNKSQVYEVLKDQHSSAQLIHTSFHFPYYGHYIDSFWVATGGFLYVGSIFHRSITSLQYIAPLMANFNVDSEKGSSVKVFDNGKSIAITWDNVTLFDSPESGRFKFQCIINIDGKIMFVYKTIPLPPVNISNSSHAVKVGISDALYIWHHGLGIVNIYEYHRILIDLRFLKSDSQILLSPLPTCLTASNCQSCFDPAIKFNCRWCVALQRCSDGIDRHRQLWLTKGCQNESLGSISECQKSSTTISSPTTSNFSDLTTASTSHYNDQQTILSTTGSSDDESSVASTTQNDINFSTTGSKATDISYHSVYLPGNLNITVFRYKNVANVTWSLSKSVKYDIMKIKIKYRSLNLVSNWKTRKSNASARSGYIIINGLNEHTQYAYQMTVTVDDSLFARGVISQEVCRNLWRWYNGRCYGYQESQKVTWEEARKLCRNFNGDLATIHNDDEMQAIESLPIRTYAWIGLRRYQHNFKWPNGVSYNYSFWEVGQPASKGRNCVALSPVNQINEYRWITQLCSYSYSYICEVPETPLDLNDSSHSDLGAVIAVTIVCIIAFGGFFAWFIYARKNSRTACIRYRTRSLLTFKTQTDFKSSTIKISRLKEEIA